MLVNDKILILPFAVADGPNIAERQFLSRQLPVLYRNAFEQRFPGRVVAAPLATEVDGRRCWVVHTRIWEDERAREFALERGYATVIIGEIGIEDAPRQVRIRALDVENGTVHFDERLEGDILEVARQSIRTLAPLVALESDAAAALFAPTTGSPDAYERYMRGLDTLLVLRSKGMHLEAPDEVMESFDEALRLDGGFGEALTAGLSCALQIIEPAGSIIPEEVVCTTLEGWSRIWPEDARIWAVLGEVHIHKKRWSEALDIMRRGLEVVRPLNRDLLRRCADVLSEVGRNDDALEIYKRCEEMRHDRALVERMGTLAILLDRLDEAREFASRVADEDPDRPDVWMRLALVEQRAGRLDQMWMALERLLETSHGPGVVELPKIGGILAQNSPPASFKKALRHWLPPVEIPAASRIVLARCLRLAGATLEARLCLDSITRERLSSEDKASIARERLNLQFPAFDKTFALMAQPIVGGGAPEDTALLDEVVKSQPDFWPARFLRGLVWSRRGEVDRAVDEFTIVLESQPENDVVWYTRGLQLLKLGRAAEAVDSIEHAVAINAKESEYFIHLALSHARCQEGRKAKDALSRALELKPDHPEHQSIIAEIDRLES